jgi:hypothetical protein
MVGRLALVWGEKLLIDCDWSIDMEALGASEIAPFEVRHAFCDAHCLEISKMKALRSPWCQGFADEYPQDETAVMLGSW